MIPENLREQRELVQAGAEVKPILFNTEMVRAILDGRKTVTRRPIKMPNVVTSETVDSVCLKGGAAHFSWSWTKEFAGFDVRMPYHPGDILYVRETWAKVGDNAYGYKADDVWLVPRWKPSIHMPYEAARIFLRVTDVRVERLQDSFFKHGSTIFSLQREGIEIGDQCRECIETYGSPCCIDDESECGVLDEVRGAFAELWDSTVPKHPNKFKRYLYFWDDNPWVWVIEFERISKEDAE